MTYTATGPSITVGVRVLADAARAALTDDLRRSPWKGSPNPYAGQCYVAAEAVFHILGGRKSGITPIHMKHESQPHWALRFADGSILDPTADQFGTVPNYAAARGATFLTVAPSKRAITLIERIKSGWVRPELRAARVGGTNGGI